MHLGKQGVILSMQKKSEVGDKKQKATSSTAQRSESKDNNDAIEVDRLLQRWH